MIKTAHVKLKQSNFLSLSSHILIALMYYVHVILSSEFVLNIQNSPQIKNRERYSIQIKRRALEGLLPSKENEDLSPKSLSFQLSLQIILKNIHLK